MDETPSLFSHKGRLAPSPTGFLHLGNAWSFLWAWLWAKSPQKQHATAQGSLILRMENIDPQRSRSEYAQNIEKDLRWLGLTWDGETLYQSTRHHAYTQALNFLEEKGYTYPCYCTRKELRTLAGAPHVDDCGAPYPGICAQLSPEERTRKEAEGRKACVRLHCQNTQKIHFIDALYGTQAFDLQQLGGDFAIRRSDGVIAYQLAVVVDDAAQNVTHIVRGADILPSTPRQLYLQHLLGYPTPKYAHVPLLLDNHGERLAKRHSALSLQALRNDGVSPERILGLLAHLAGFEKGCPMRPVFLEELRENFSFSAFPLLHKAHDITVQETHLAFLYNEKEIFY